MYQNNTRRIQPDDIPIPDAHQNIQQLPQRPDPDQFYEIETPVRLSLNPCLVVFLFVSFSVQF